ncbi:MAG: hypothetical protein LUQ71_10350 [Methanoregula sp.]|nr:hypothetical protein [Methanoregula sp.]
MQKKKTVTMDMVPPAPIDCSHRCYGAFSLHPSPKPRKDRQQDRIDFDL